MSQWPEFESSLSGVGSRTTDKQTVAFKHIERVYKTQDLALGLRIRVGLRIANKYLHVTYPDFRRKGEKKAMRAGMLLYKWFFCQWPENDMTSIWDKIGLKQKCKVLQSLELLNDSL